jgi:hypothetical protein
MNPSKKLSAVFLLVLSASLLAQVASRHELSEAQMNAAVARAKITPASKLDASLPSVALEQWLQEQAGPGAKLAWAYRYDPDGAASHGFADSVEADATMPDGRTFFLMIDVSRAAFRFREGTVVTGTRNGIDFARLRDLPRTLRTTSQNLTPAEAHDE